MAARGSERSDERAGEEATLVARIAGENDEAAMESLCRVYAGPLHALGMRLLGDRGAAEEMVQDAFVRLWRNAGRYDAAKGSVRTYLYTIARRAAIDIRRRSTSRPAATAELDEGQIADHGAGGPDAFDRIVLGLAVREALSTLSRKHRETLDLQYREDLTQRQIANRLEIPLGTVKTRTYHALRALKKELEERDIAT